MSIRMLRTLIAVEEHKTFSAAAGAVYLTHAAVSQQMRTLEAEWGVTLFDRSKRVPKLNALGREVVVKAREVVRAYDAIIPSSLGSTGLSGEVSLGTVPTTLTGLAPLAATVLKERLPDLHVHVHPALTIPLLAQLERGILDAAIVTRPAALPAGIAFADLAEEPLQLLASSDAESDDPFELLANYPFIRFSREAVVGNLVEAWLQKHGIRVKEAMELENLEAISSMVFANLGVSIVPRSCVQSFNPLPIKRLSLGDDGPTRTLSLIYQENSPRMRVIEELLNAVREAIRIGILDPAYKVTK